MQIRWKRKTVGGTTGFKLAPLVVFALTCISSTPSMGAGWETLPSTMPTPRDEIASCHIGNFIYVLGGADDLAPASNLNERYNTETDSWAQRQRMPTARKNLTALASDGKCFAIGGENEQEGLQSVEIYDPAADQWTAGQFMPTARLAPTAAVIEGKIYVVGGVDVESFSSDYLKILEVYDPTSDSWETLAPMPTGRGYMTANVIDDKLYVIGGTTGFRAPSDVVEVYDPASNSWFQAEAMPAELYYLASAVKNNMIYVTGGIGLSEQTGLGTKSDTQVYDPTTNSWTIAEPLQLARNRHISHSSENKIFVIGGAENVGHPHATTGSVEVLQMEDSFAINPGHAGAWFNPETSGQGQFIDVVPEDQFMFISWFTFTGADSANPNEQQWYTAQGNYSGDTAVLDLFETLGGKFDDPQEVTTTQVGEVMLSFSDCDQGQMTYLFDEEELEGEFPLIRVIPGSDNVCEGLSGNNTEAVDINAGMDGAWFDPDTSGQGYFIDAHPDPEGGNFIFVSWFTYGDATASGQRWLTAQGGFEGSTAEIDVFETTGGSFDDPEPVSTTKVGTMSLDFTDCSNAQLTYSLPADPAEGDIAITRVIPGSQALCEELVGAD